MIQELYDAIVNKNQHTREVLMNGIVKGMILVVVILYMVSPVDACPGPIDDIIVLMLGLAARKGLSAREDYTYD